VKQLALVVVLVASQAQAQVVAGLKEFLDAADQQNVDRRISLEQRERAVWEYRQAWTGLLPAFSASATYTRQDPVTFQTGPTTVITLSAQDQWDGTVRFDLPIIDTTRWMRVLAAGASEAGAKEREQVMRDLVRKQVVASYFGLAATQALRESSLKSLAVAEAQLKLQEIRVSAGAVTELELLRARAEVQRNRQLIVDTDSLVATSRRTLRTLSGREPPALVSLPEADLRPEPAFAELEQGLDGLPSVKAADRDAEAAGKLATAAKLALVPVIGAQITERFTNASGLLGKAAVYTTGATATWRLDGPTLMGIGVQSHAESTALLAAEKARQVARDQIHSDWQRFNAALQKIDAAETQVQAASRAAQVSRDRYAVGAATQVDVIQAERDLFTAEVAQIQARTDLATARLSLRLSAGRPLE
jgi:outer membrane protein TolC